MKSSFRQWSLVKKQSARSLARKYSLLIGSVANNAV